MKARARFRTALALVAGTVIGGASVLATTGVAHANSTFVLTRLAGTDRYQTASVIDQATYPNGEPTALLADGVTGHQSDALASSGVEGVFATGALLTDNTNTVPSSTMSALSANHVKNVVVVGGVGAVSQAQINQLKAAGYQVSTPYQGATRWQTMQKIDASMGSAGTDSSGLPTGILASGEDAHLVDALAAGGLAYAKHFPIILTNSEGPALQPEAQQVISSMGIKHLIVVGGTAAIPASEYSPPPSGVTKVDVEAGANRSATSATLADFAIGNTWLANTNLTVARGDDGADALAGAAFAGSHGWPTVVTTSPSDAGSTTAFATEHKDTLAGTSYIFGGLAAVPDSQKNAIQAAGQGTPASTAPAGTFGTAGGTTPVVTAESKTSFTQNNLTYTYQPTDTYQIVTTSSNPGSSPSCGSDPGGFSDFQARLSNGDSVSGNYQPTGTSTFCLNDVAPHPPSSANATTNSTGGGVTVTWTAPSQSSTDNVTDYTIWRAPANVPNPQAPSQFATCPAANTVAPGTSPQTSPSGYTAIATVPAGTSSTGSYDDLSATSGNTYCYAVSSVAPNAAGGNQTGTAVPAPPGSNPLQASSPAPTAGAGSGQPGAASAGKFGSPGSSGPLVTSENGTSFTQGGQSYNYGSGDTYQLVTTGSTPGSQPSCSTTISASEFQSRLTNGDSVSGDYEPSSQSTFCLNDIAPHPPSSASASTNSSGGVTVTWTPPATQQTDAVSSYTIWRAAATAQIPMSGQFSCPAAYTVAPGTSPQTPPQGYTAVGSAPAGTNSFNDPNATAGNTYCYAVSSVAPNAAGASQTGTAQPATSSNSTPFTPPAQPGPVAGSGTGGTAVAAPVSVSTSANDSGQPAASSSCTAPDGTKTGCLTSGSVLTATFSQPMTVAGNWSLTLAAQCTTSPKTGTCPNSANPLALNPSNASAAANGNTVTFTVNLAPLSGSSPPAPSGSVALDDLEAVAESGITSVPSSGSLPWNLPGSAVGAGTSTNRVFAGSNADLPGPPSVFSVGGGSNGNSMSYRCNDTGSTQLNIYNGQGTQLAHAPCGAVGTTQTATPTPESGQPTPFTFTSGATYLYTETDGSPGTNQESQATSTVTPQPAPAMSSITATDSSATLTITYNESIACPTVDSDGSDYTVGYYLTATGPPVTHTYSGTETFKPTSACSSSSAAGTRSSTVTLVGGAGTAPFAPGYTIVVTAKSGTDADTVCVQSSPNNTNCEAVGDQKTATT